MVTGGGGGSFPEVKRQGREVNPLNAELNPTCYLMALLGAHHILRISRIRVKRSLASSTEVEKEWNYTSTSPVCFHGVNRDNINFAFFLKLIIIKW
jgi:hypothetical protein